MLVWFGLGCCCRGSREYEEILNFINEQITPHLRLALRAVGALLCAPSGRMRAGAMRLAALGPRLYRRSAALLVLLRRGVSSG